jgi:hypothetical protein
MAQVRSAWYKTIDTIRIFHLVDGMASLSCLGVIRQRMTDLVELADKGYDANYIGDDLRHRTINAIIPLKRKKPRVSGTLYLFRTALQVHTFDCVPQPHPN